MAHLTHGFLLVRRFIGLLFLPAAHEIVQMFDFLLIHEAFLIISVDLATNGLVSFE